MSLGYDSGVESGPRPTLTPGSSVGPYVVVERLGHGGMGEVFLARDTRLQRKVALKYLRADVDTVDAHAVLLREARALAKINHPNIAAIHDVIEDGGRAFIVMEYVEGESLAAKVIRERVPIDAVIAIGRQIAAGLGAAHAAGVIHRDLKPSNVQLTPSGVVKILDFGIAKITISIASAQSSAGGNTSDIGARAGTPAYMSPEQKLARPVDERSDIYSLGLVLLEMAAGNENPRPGHERPVPRGGRRHGDARGAPGRAVRAGGDHLARD